MIFISIRRLQLLHLLPPPPLLLLLFHSLPPLFLRRPFLPATFSSLSSSSPIPPSFSPWIDPRPRLIFSGSCLELAQSRGIGAAHVSLSHEQDYAIAYVALEKQKL